MVLDRCANTYHDPEAEGVAQQIVDFIGHRVTDEPPHLRVLIEKMAEAISVSADYFNARDEMNGAVHAPAPVRKSPITEVVNDALESWRRWEFGVSPNPRSEP